MQWYTGDWLKDPAVSVLTPAARGVWFDFLNVMHESDRSGVITGTRDQLCRLGRCSAVELDHTLNELTTTKAADVTERCGIVTVKNRRMRRESKKRKGSNLRMKRHRELRDGYAPRARDSSSYSESEGREREPRPPEIPPMSRKDFNKLVEMRAIPPECAEWFWNTNDARDWRDSTGQAIRKVEPLLLNCAKNWRVSSRQWSSKSAGRNGADTVVLGKEYERVIKRMDVIKSQYADHQTWDQKDRDEWKTLVARKKELAGILNITH